MKITPPQFAVLSAVTFLTVVTAAASYSYFNRWTPGKVEGAVLLPVLARDVGNAALIEVSQADRKLVLERSGEQWRLKDRDGYPANGERVRALLLTLQRAEVIERKTAAADKHKLLELEDPTGKDAKSRSVRVIDKQGRPIADIVLGKARADAFGSGKGGTYVRRPTETQTWLATGELKPAVEPRDWVQTSVFEQDAAKIKRITLEHPGEEPIVIEKSDGDQKFQLAAVPDGQKLKGGVTVDPIAQGFAMIDLDDVRKLDGAPSGDKVSVLKVETEAGLVATFRLRRDGEASWLSLVATGGEGDAKKSADDLNARAKGWEFKVPQWKADQIGKRRADLFETS